MEGAKKKKITMATNMTLIGICGHFLLSPVIDLDYFSTCNFAAKLLFTIQKQEAWRIYSGHVTIGFQRRLETRL